jgi:hypothetical protein
MLPLNHWRTFGSLRCELPLSAASAYDHDSPLSQ